MRDRHPEFQEGDGVGVRPGSSPCSLHCSFASTELCPLPAQPSPGAPTQDPQRPGGFPPACLPLLLAPLAKPPAIRPATPVALPACSHVPLPTAGLQQCLPILCWTRGSPGAQRPLVGPEPGRPRPGGYSPPPRTWESPQPECSSPHSLTPISQEEKPASPAPPGSAPEGEGVRTRKGAPQLPLLSPRVCPTLSSVLGLESGHLRMDGEDCVVTEVCLEEWAGVGGAVPRPRLSVLGSPASC